MFFTARSRKKGTRPNDSHSKDSKKSGLIHNKQKLELATANQLRLRQSINAKFQKSKMRNYKYSIAQTNTPRKLQSKDKSRHSENSADMHQYAHLVSLRYIDLKEYRRCKNSESQNRKFFIRIRNSENKRTISSDFDELDSPKKNQNARTIEQDKTTRESAFVKKNPKPCNIIKYQKKALSADKSELQARYNHKESRSNEKYNSFHFKRTVTEEEEVRNRPYIIRKPKNYPIQLNRALYF